MASDASLLSSMLDESSLHESTVVDSLWGKLDMVVVLASVGDLVVVTTGVIGWNVVLSHERNLMRHEVDE